MLQRPVIQHIRVAVGILDLLRWRRRRSISLLIHVDWRNICGGIAVACLLSVSNEILEVLYGRHTDPIQMQASEDSM